MSGVKRLKLHTHTHAFEMELIKHYRRWNWKWNSLEYIIGLRYGCWWRFSILDRQSTNDRRFSCLLLIASPSPPVGSLVAWEKKSEARWSATKRRVSGLHFICKIMCVCYSWCGFRDCSMFRPLLSRSLLSIDARDSMVWRHGGARNQWLLEAVRFLGRTEELSAWEFETIRANSSSLSLCFARQTMTCTCFSLSKYEIKRNCLHRQQPQDNIKL